MVAQLVCQWFAQVCGSILPEFCHVLVPRWSYLCIYYDQLAQGIWYVVQCNSHLFEHIGIPHPNDDKPHLVQSNRETRLSQLRKICLCLQSTVVVEPCSQNVALHHSSMSLVASSSLASFLWASRRLWRGSSWNQSWMNWCSPLIQWRFSMKILLGWRKTRSCLILQ